MKTKPARNQTPTEIAETLGVAEKTVRRWCALKSKPCPNTRRLNGSLSLNAAEVAAWMKANGVTGAPGRPDGGSPEARVQKTRQISAMADYWELRTKQLAGGLMDAAAVEQEFAALAALVRNSFANLASQLVPMALAHGLPHEAASTFQDQAEAAIAGILRRLSKTDDAGDSDDDSEGKD